MNSNKEVIEHWKRILMRIDVPDSSQCAFCRKWNNLEMLHQREYECKKCPIFKITGEKYCYGTPYYLAYREYYLTNNIKYQLEMLQWLKDNLSYER